MIYSRLRDRVEAMANKVDNEGYCSQCGHRVYNGNTICEHCRQVEVIMENLNHHNRLQRTIK